MYFLNLVNIYIYISHLHTLYSGVSHIYQNPPAIRTLKNPHISAYEVHIWGYSPHMRAIYYI